MEREEDRQLRWARWRCHREEQRGVVADHGHDSAVESLLERTSGRGF
jgi:hypothetical protein